MKNWVSLFFFLLCVFLIGAIGGIFTQDSVNSWYLTLKKANWNPPPYVFGPVWTILYFMIGISGWLAFLSSRRKKCFFAFSAYAAQLFINFLWPLLFFYLRNPLLGLIDIILLFLLIIINIISFWKISPIASYLLIPYCFWVAYAFTLNLAIWILN